MTTYESDIKTISSNEEVVFAILSDFKNIQKYQSKTNLTDKIQNLQFDTDSISFDVEMIGKIGFRIVEREAFKTIKLQSENAPVGMNVWIQLKQVSENDTRMKLTLQAELPAMIKMMVDKKLQEGINMVAETIANVLNTSVK